MRHRVISPLFPGAVMILAVAAWVPAVAGPSGDTGRTPAPRRVDAAAQARALAPGRLLVAARDLRDPNFAETVVLLVDYSADGAAGLVVNVPVDVSVARLFPRPGLTEEASGSAYYGGPVSATSALALVLATAPLTGARPVVGDVQLVATRSLMEEMLEDRVDTGRSRVYLGRSGWGPGQLDREHSLGAWHVFDADADTIFAPEPAGVWERLIARTEVLQADGRVPARIVSRLRLVVEPQAAATHP